jgi:hypothetical protein
MSDIAKAQDQSSAQVIRSAGNQEHVAVHGVFVAACYGPDGALKWSDVAYNTVVNVGVRFNLDQFFEGAAYTVIGPFMGLISDDSFSAIDTLDTMASHGGWLEAGTANPPTYTAPRKDLSTEWAAAATRTKALSGPQAYAITGTGTVRGVFLVMGTGAVSTIDNTSGTLWSAGLFATPKVVGNGDTLNVSYSVSL